MVDGRDGREVRRRHAGRPLEDHAAAAGEDAVDRTVHGIRVDRGT
jgi:hypothetical protein